MKKNILYLNNVIGEAPIKALTSYIKFKKLDNISFNVLYDESLLNHINQIITLDKYANFTEHFWDSFFIESFLKDDRFNFDHIESDYEIVKDDFPFSVDFEAFYEHVRLADILIKKILQINPDYLLHRLIIGDRLYISYYIAFQVKKRNPNIKIIAGGEKDLKPTNYYNDLFRPVVDHLYFGFAEHLLEMLNNDIELEKTNMNYAYTEDLWRSFNFTLTEPEIQNNKYFSIPNLKCTANCDFCSVFKKFDQCFQYDDAALAELTDFIMFMNTKHPGIKTHFVSSLAFKTSSNIEYFFKTLYDNGFHKAGNFNLSLLYIIGKQYYDNRELLNKFERNTFNCGIEHTNEKILRSMNKPISSKIAKELIIKPNNITFAFIWNYFEESKEEFDEIITFSKIIKKLKYHNPRYFQLQYSALGDVKEDERKHNITFVVPHIYKDFYGIDEDEFYFNYRNNLDPENVLMRYKRDKLEKLGFTEDGIV